MQVSSSISDPFEQILLRETSEAIKTEYSKLLGKGGVSATTAINIIGANAKGIFMEVLYELIMITVTNGTPDLLQMIMDTLSAELHRINNQYIFGYIHHSCIPYNDNFIVEKFKILWNARRSYQSHRSIHDRMLTIIINTLRDNVGVYYMAEITRICISMTGIIIDSMELDIPSVILPIIFKIACYDKSLELFRDLLRMGYRISGDISFRNDIVMECVYLPDKSLPETVGLVDCLLDQELDPSELYPFYIWAINRVRYDRTVLEYLIDIGVRVPIGRKEFFKIVYGTDVHYRLDSVIFTLLGDVFD